MTELTDIVRSKYKDMLYTWTFQTNHCYAFVKDFK